MAFTLVNDYTPSGGPIAASPNPGNIGNGFTDQSGVWYIDASNYLRQPGTVDSPFNKYYLARLGTASLSVNSQVITRIQWVGVGLFTEHRLNGTQPNPTSYMTNVYSNGIYFYKNVNGTFNQLGSTVAISPALTGGALYDVISTVTQTNSTTSTLSVLIQDVNGNTIGTASVTDTTSALQNLSGGVAICFNNTNADGAVTRIRNYVDNGTTTPPTTSATQIIAGRPFAVIGAGSTGTSVVQSAACALVAVEHESITDMNTSVVVTLYDSASTATGRVLWRGSLGAGQQVQIGEQALNGIVASVSGGSLNSDGGINVVYASA